MTIDSKYDSCPQCTDNAYRHVYPEDDDSEVVECHSCRTPLRLSWLNLDVWTDATKGVEA